MRTSIYHNDHLMTPLRLTASDQSIAWSADYKAFGEVSVSGDISNNLRFPGQWSDGESELYYNHNRYYISQLSIYTSKDPYNDLNYLSTIRVNMNDYNLIIGRLSRFGLYNYSLNNPVIKLDPKGLIDEESNKYLNCVAQAHQNLADCIVFCALITEPVATACTLACAIGKDRRACIACVIQLEVLDIICYSSCYATYRREINKCKPPKCLTFA